MSFLSYALLIAVFIVLLVFVALLMSPRSTSGIAVNLDKDKGATVTLNDGAVTIGTGAGQKVEIKYNTWEDRPSDYDLFPEMVEDPRPAESASASFLSKLDNFEHLDTAEKQEVLRTLAAYGFIRVDDIEKYSIPDPDVEKEDSPEQENPEPRKGGQEEQLQDADFDLDPYAAPEEGLGQVNHEFDI